VSTHREKESIATFLAPGGESVIKHFSGVYLYKTALFIFSVQPHKVQKLQLTWSYFLFQLQYSLGNRYILTES